MAIGIAATSRVIVAVGKGLKVPPCAPSAVVTSGAVTTKASGAETTKASGGTQAGGVAVHPPRGAASSRRGVRGTRRAAPTVPRVAAESRAVGGVSSVPPRAQLVLGSAPVRGASTTTSRKRRVDGARRGK